MTDVPAYIQSLLEAEPLRAPLLHSVIQSLQLPKGSYGLDAGCGIGLQAVLLAEAVGADGLIVGLDILPELLAFGQDVVKRAGTSDRIVFGSGDVGTLPYAEDCFDFAWSADCIGYPAGDLLPPLEELIRVVRPGGSIILLGWTTQQLLPGYPLLEARLNAAFSAYIPHLQGKGPDQNFLRAIHWLERVGLEDVQARTFVSDIQSPFSSGERSALIALFEMLWGRPGLAGAPSDEALLEDWETYVRLCDPGSEQFILDIPGYYAFFTYTLFRGTAPLKGKR